MTKKERHIAYINATKDYMSNGYFMDGICKAIIRNNEQSFYSLEKQFPELYLFNEYGCDGPNYYWWFDHQQDERALALAFMIAMTE